MALDDVLKELADHITPNANDKIPVEMRGGTVAAVNTVAKTISLYLGGDTSTAITGVTYVGSDPAVSDTVVVLKAGPKLIALTKG